MVLFPEYQNSPGLSRDQPQTDLSLVIGLETPASHLVSLALLDELLVLPELQKELNHQLSVEDHCWLLVSLLVVQLAFGSTSTVYQQEERSKVTDSELEQLSLEHTNFHSVEEDAFEKQLLTVVQTDQPENVWNMDLLVVNKVDNKTKVAERIVDLEDIDQSEEVEDIDAIEQVEHIDQVEEEEDNVTFVGFEDIDPIEEGEVEEEDSKKDADPKALVDPFVVEIVVIVETVVIVVIVRRNFVAETTELGMVV
jgi:hypothetical protein